MRLVATEARSDEGELEAAWEQERRIRAEKEAQKKRDKERVSKANELRELDNKPLNEAIILADRAAIAATAAYEAARQKGAVVEQLISAKTKREREVDAKRRRLQAHEELLAQPPPLIRRYGITGSDSEELSDDEEDLEAEFNSLDAGILEAKQVHEEATQAALELKKTADKMQTACNWRRVLSA